MKTEDYKRLTYNKNDGWKEETVRRLTFDGSEDWKQNKLSEEKIIVKIQEIIDYQNLSTEIGFIDQSDSVKAIQRFIRPIQSRKRKE